MISRLLDTLFGCSHARYSFPITVRSHVRRRGGALLTGTYVTCLDCGKELPYDWNEMKIVSASRAQRAHVRALATKEAA